MHLIEYINYPKLVVNIKKNLKKDNLTVFEPKHLLRVSYAPTFFMNDNPHNNLIWKSPPHLKSYGVSADRVI